MPIKKFTANTAIDRLWKKVSPEPNSGCWLWMGKLNNYGYGLMTHYGGKVRGVHVISYESYIGPRPEGKVIDHLCRVRCCCNPDHLEPVTFLENIRRGKLAVGPISHCKRGHEFTVANTRHLPGRRICLACKAIRNKAYYEKHHGQR